MELIAALKSGISVSLNDLSADEFYAIVTYFDCVREKERQEQPSQRVMMF